MRLTVFILLILAVGCASTQPAVISCPPATVITNTIHDTLYKEKIVESVHYITNDTATNSITLTAINGDNYQQLQDAIHFCLDSHWPLNLKGGYYPISQPLIVYKIVNGEYQQVSITINGAEYGRNVSGGAGSIIAPMFNNTFALGVQQGKSCVFNNLIFSGQYLLPGTLNTIQIDTLSFNGWSDGRTSDNQTSPYSAICIDPFSDSTIGYNGTTVKMYDGLHSYYMPGMNRNGSTDIKISGCGISNFVVGIMCDPSNEQNGELISVTDCRIDNVKICYAYTNAQQKANTITNLMCWGQVHTILDGQHYGFRYGDGATCPMVDVMNIAGSVYQLIEGYAVTFPISIKRVYAEGIFKIGSTGGNAGVHFDDCQIDLQMSDINVPTPDFVLLGDNILWTGGHIRVYNGLTYNNRFTMSGRQFYNNCMMSSPPVVTDIQQIYNNNNILPLKPTFSNDLMYYDNAILLSRNDYDTTIIVSGNSKPTVHIDRSSFTGYFVTTNSIAADDGDFLLTIKGYDEYGIQTYQYPVGFVTNVSGDTVYLNHMGSGIQDGEKLYIWGDRIKTTL